jgi:hypothetical protein
VQPARDKAHGRFGTARLADAGWLAKTLSHKAGDVRERHLVSHMQHPIS